MITKIIQAQNCCECPYCVPNKKFWDCEKSVFEGWDYAWHEIHILCPFSDLRKCICGNCKYYHINFDCICTVWNKFVQHNEFCSHFTMFY